MKLREDEKPLGRFDYSLLLELAKTKVGSISTLRRKGVISGSIERRIRNGMPIASNVIASICDFFNCQPCDIMEYIPPEQ